MVGNVTALAKRADATKKENEAWLRRQAIQLAVQLPENYNDARRVLELTRAILDTFLDAETRPV